MDTPFTSSLTAESAAAIVDLLAALEPSRPAPATAKKADAPRKPKVIAYSEIREKVRNIGGRQFGGDVLKGSAADVLPGQFIRIFGTYHNRREPKYYDLRSLVGHQAVYDRGSLVSIGTIEAIGAKTITVRDDEQVKRLDLAEFTEMNWNFDAAKIAKKNAEWMD